ncbi:MAG: iron-sulfur cluster assembly accessory protein [Thiohalobacteraceae bacterium]|nr:iron-sulfur cluster assembly accessory protein [Gammaproteobacteria bacterium]
MGIQLTEAAAQRVRTMLGKRGHGLGLRLGTRKSGCSGFAYVVDYADEIGADDRVFESHGVTVVVDTGSLQQLEDMEIDYVRNNALNEGFEFRNPNVKDTCGCGESFSV